MEDVKVSRLTVNDYQILAIMHKNKYDAPLKAISYQDIMVETNLSINKVRKSVNSFVEYGYVEEGFRKVNSKRFYITDLGIKIVLDAVKL